MYIHIYIYIYIYTYITYITKPYDITPVLHIAFDYI